MLIGHLYAQVNLRAAVLASVALVACIVSISGCTDRQSPPTPVTKTASKSAPISPWKMESHKDAMSDKAITTISTRDDENHASFSVICGEDGKVFDFTSDLFLGSNNYQDIQYRFDGEKYVDARALANKTSAMLLYPKSMKEAFKMGGDRMIAAVNGWELAEELRDRKHERLRARLSSFDGNHIDLDFNISGVQQKLLELEKICDGKAS